jgi:hypothetical protein
MLTRRTFLGTGVIGPVLAASPMALQDDKRNIQAQTYGPPSPTGPTDHAGAFATYEPPHPRPTSTPLP